MIEPLDRKIYLIWQEAIHGNRLVVGELIQKPNNRYIFRYLPEKDLIEAQKQGFSGYPSFPDLNCEYHENVIESFSMRLPSRSRDDFGSFLEYWEVENPDISDFDLLSVTGASLPTDHFELIDPHNEKRPTHFLSEIAGLQYYENNVKDIQSLKGFQEGDSVRIEREPNNLKDPNAVKVLYNKKQVGYINKVHAQTISQELASDKRVSAEIKHIDANGIINSVLLRVKIDA